MRKAWQRNKSESGIETCCGFAFGIDHEDGRCFSLDILTSDFGKAFIQNWHAAIEIPAIMLLTQRFANEIVHRLSTRVR